MLKHIAAIALAALVATPVLAQDKPETPEARVAKPKKICRVDRNTGSRLGAVRTCKTREEWTVIDADAARDVQGKLQSSAGTPR